MKKILPRKLVFKYEVFTGYQFSLKCKDDVLVVKQHSNDSHGDKLVEIVPDSEKWADFWNSIFEMDVWDWYEVYEVKCMDSCVEGDEWEVCIEFDDNLIRSQGSNSYPPSFREFIMAVEELTGILIEFIHED